MAKHNRQSMSYFSAILLLVFTTVPEPLVVVSITDSNVLVTTLSVANDISNIVLNLRVGTPPQTLPLRLDVQSPFTTLHCTNADLNSSSSFHPILSSTFLAPSSASDACVAPSPSSESSPPSPSQTCACAQDTANLYIERTQFPDPLLSANVSAVKFTCCAELQNSGVAGLSKGDRSLAAQISKSGGLARQFSYCLPSIAFFGRVTTYALLNAPVGQMENFTTSLPMKLYYVKGGGYALKVQNMSMGGDGVMERPMKMRVSTTQMYTTLERKVYMAFRASFRQAVGYGKGVQAVSAIEPFDTCFDTSPLYYAGKAPYLKAPIMRVQVEGGGWLWYPRSTFEYDVGSNNSLVACMAFLQAAPGQPSVLGTFQQLDCLAEFDLQRSRFGFGSIFNPFGFHPEAPRCASLQYPMYHPF